MAEPAHAEALRRMVETGPLAPAEATDEELVEALIRGRDRMPAFLRLYSRGERALPAVRSGLGHASADVRRWCAILIDNFADPVSLQALVPLLHDPVAAVRAWAVHALACDSCKSGPNPVDAVPLLLERIEQDPAERVRRQAVAMLAQHLAPDARALPTLRRLADAEPEGKIRRHAAEGVQRYGVAGLR